jgi:hypothetical protein
VTTDVGSGTVGSGSGLGDGSFCCAGGDEDVAGELAVFGFPGAPGVCAGLMGDGVGRCVEFGVGCATPVLVPVAPAFRRFGSARAGVVVRSGRWFVIAWSGTTMVRCPDA